MTQRTGVSPRPSNATFVAVCERAVRLVSAQQSFYETQWAATHSMADNFWSSAWALRMWVRRAERDAGQKPGPTATSVSN